MRTAAIDALLFVMWGLASPAQTTPVFRGDSSLASVDVQVYDRNTLRPIAGCGTPDFEILEDGFPLRVVACEQAESALDAVLVIQTGRPLPRDRTAARVRAQLRGLVGDLGPEDRIAVLSYGSKPKIHCPLTADSGATLSGILEALRARHGYAEGWRLRDAVLAATELFPKTIERGRRRAVALVHDRGEARSAASADQVATALLEKSAVFYGAKVDDPRPRASGGIKIGVGSGVPKMPKTPEAPAVSGLEEMAAATGGEILRGTEAIALIGDALTRLRTRYLIYFRPPPARGEARLRRISVALSRDGRARHPAGQVRGQREYLW